MSKPYSVDLREKVLEYLEKGNSKKAASKTFSIGIATIYRWVLQYKIKGHLKPKKSFSLLEELIEKSLKALLRKNQMHFYMKLQNIFLFPLKLFSMLVKEQILLEKKDKPLFRKRFREERIIYSRVRKNPNKKSSLYR